MFSLRLAFKNLLRSKRRTILSSAAVVVGIFYLIVGRAFIGGVEESIVYMGVNGQTGHVTLRGADYPTQGMTFPLDKRPPSNAGLDAWVADQKASTSRQIYMATAVSGADSMRARLIAVDWDSDATVFAQDTWKIDGSKPTSAADGILVTNGLAALLDVQTGDRLVLKARTDGGALNALSVPIAGLVNTGNLGQSKTTIFLTKDLSEELVRTAEPTHVSVLLRDRDDAPQAAEAMVAAAGGGEAITWITETEDLLRLQQVRRTSLNVLVGMLLLMSSLAIANTILMAAHERVAEVGTLRAMGMSRRGVLGLFLTEGALLGVGAGGLGAAMGGGLAYYLSKNPIDLSAMTEDLEYNFDFSSYIYTAFDAELVLVPLLISVAVAVLASVYPAITASRLEPADAVRAD